MTWRGAVAASTGAIAAAGAAGDVGARHGEPWNAACSAEKLVQQCNTWTFSINFCNTKLWVSKAAEGAQSTCRGTRARVAIFKERPHLQRVLGRGGLGDRLQEIRAGVGDVPRAKADLRRAAAARRRPPLSGLKRLLLRATRTRARLRGGVGSVTIRTEGRASSTMGPIGPC